MKKIIYAILIIVLIIAIILVINYYKNQKTGNNISNKSIDEIENYILNIESYKATANIEVQSNKNRNVYVVEQTYVKENNLYKQVVVEPVNLAGIEFSYNGNNLEVKNSKLNLSKIYTDYKYIESNELSLIKFIEDYNKNENKKIYEENGKIIMEVENSHKNKKLFINKEQSTIEKMEIKDITQKTTIYILYTKVEINTVNKEEITAFSIKTVNKNI